MGEIVPLPLRHRDAQAAWRRIDECTLILDAICGWAADLDVDEDELLHAVRRHAREERIAPVSRATLRTALRQRGLSERTEPGRVLWSGIELLRRPA